MILVIPLSGTSVSDYRESTFLALKGTVGLILHDNYTLTTPGILLEV
jgi:hypothetical protein